MNAFYHEEAIKTAADAVVTHSRKLDHAQKAVQKANAVIDDLRGQLAAAERESWKAHTERNEAEGEYLRAKSVYESTTEALLVAKSLG